MNYRNVLHIAVVLLFSIISISLIGCSEDSPIETHDEHFEAEGFILYNEAGNKVLDYFQAQTNDTLYVPNGGTTGILRVMFYDHDGNEIAPPLEEEGHEEETKTFGWVIDDPGLLSLILETGQEWNFRLYGLAAGTTAIEFQTLHGDHPDFRTVKIPVVIE